MKITDLRSVALAVSFITEMGGSHKVSANKRHHVKCLINAKRSLVAHNENALVSNEDHILIDCLLT